MKADRRLVLGWILPVLVIAALIGLWQIAAASGWIAQALNLEPHAIAVDADLNHLPSRLPAIPPYYIAYRSYVGMNVIRCSSVNEV